MTALATLLHSARMPGLHPALWVAMALRYPWLLIVTNGVRIVTTVLATTILVRWSPSAARYLRGRGANGDARRTGWLPMAVATLIFNARWFLPIFVDLTRDRMALAGQVAVLVSLAFALYAHGRDHDEIHLRRAILIYAGMLVIGIGASAILR